MEGALCFTNSPDLRQTGFCGDNISVVLVSTENLDLNLLTDELHKLEQNM